MKRLGLFMLALLSGCGGAQAGTQASREPESEARGVAAEGSLEGWPAEAIVAAGRGPGLYLGPEPASPAIGYLSEGVAVELAGAPERGRVLVRVRGAMRVRGYIPVQRLEAKVLRRGRVRDTPVYVGPGDHVRVLGGAEAGRTFVAVTPRLVTRAGVEIPAPSYEGSFPSVGLGAALDGAAEGVPGEPIELKGATPIRVFDAPGGRLLLTLPAGETLSGYEVKREGGFSAVLLGEGPYLAGYVAEMPKPAAKRERAAQPSVAASGVPARLREDDAERPLHRVAEGTRVVFDGVTIASIDRPAYAREMARHEATGEVDVFVAVDDAVAVRGMVPAETLSPAP